MRFSSTTSRTSARSSSLISFSKCIVAMISSTVNSNLRSPTVGLTMKRPTGASMGTVCSLLVRFLTLMCA